MKLEISLVPPTLCHFYSAGLRPYLEKSEAWTRGRATIEDIIDFIVTGRMSLWMVYDSEENPIKPYGYVITEVKEYPQCKMLIIQYCAGEANHMSYVEDEMYATLESYAADASCAGVEFFGRPGWSRYAKKHGYQVQTIVYEKYFNEVQQ